MHRTQCRQRLRMKPGFSSLEKRSFRYSARILPSKTSKISVLERLSSALEEVVLRANKRPLKRILYCKSEKLIQRMCIDHNRRQRPTVYHACNFHSWVGYLWMKQVGPTTRQPLVLAFTHIHMLRRIRSNRRFYRMFTMHSIKIRADVHARSGSSFLMNTVGNFDRFLSIHFHVVRRKIESENNNVDLRKRKIAFRQKWAVAIHVKPLELMTSPIYKKP